MSEVITSLDLNFVNNGGGHTASITTVLNSVSVSGESELGVLNGSLGERYAFSNSKIQDLMSKFVAINETVSEQSDNVITKVTKFQDEISLRLKSHVLLCRGTSASPFGGQYFDGSVFAYSELGLAAPSVPKQEVEKFGGVFIAGQTYNSKSGSSPDDGEYQVVFREGGVVGKFSSNLGAYASDPDNSDGPLYDGFGLKYGYELKDVKQVLNMLGISVKGMPDDVPMLYETSGTLESVLGNIAQSLGYYWTINPFSGQIEFINSMDAMQIPILNPNDLPNSEKIKMQQTSFSESKIKKTIVNSFIGDYQDELNNNGVDDEEEEDRVRRTSFILATPDLYLDDKFYINLGYLYGLWATENWNNFMFDALFYYIVFTQDDFFDKDTYPDLPELIPVDKEEYAYNELIGYDVDLAEQTKQSKSAFGDRTEATYYNLMAGSSADEEIDASYLGAKKMIKPSSHEIYPAIKAYFDTIGKSLYFSPTYTESKASRLEWVNTEGFEVFGPFEKTKKLSEIEELDFLKPLLEFFDKEVKLEDFLPPAPEDREFGVSYPSMVISHDFMFIALKSNKKETKIDLKKNKNKPLDFGSYLTEKNVENVYNSPFSDNTYVGFKEEATDELEEAIERSKKLFSDAETEAEKRLQVFYVLHKRPLDEQEEEDQEEPTPDEGPAAEDNSDASKRKFYDILNNSTGNPLQPITLEHTKGGMAEIKALRANAARISDLSSNTMKSSSVTYFSLEIPTESEYNITMNSVSIKLNGGNGVSTTISQSNKDIIPEDDAIVIGRYYKAINQRSSSNKFSARQRNFFGL